MKILFFFSFSKDICIDVPSYDNRDFRVTDQTKNYFDKVYIEHRVLNTRKKQQKQKQTIQKIRVQEHELLKLSLRCHDEKTT